MLGHAYRAVMRQNPQYNLVDSFLKGEVDRLGESLYQLFRDTPHIYLAFAHLKLVSLTLPGFPSCVATERVELARTIVDQLGSTTRGLRPLTHHFAGLAAIALAEDLGNEQSVLALQKLRVILDTGYVHEEIESSKSRPHTTMWNAPISSFITKKLGDGAPTTVDDPNTSHGGLQHLADAAVGNGSNGGATDWHAVGVKGFLTEFE